ncbi:MAG TPA: EAL domain-containing protein [Thermomonas sp.]|jgi:diguanylate cyclase (GGDEF)-like protein|uniref:putative bifunctional diguanylate cyclase/phosphodiesterase n=1 Tax=Thermomonas sp. TaxID=1971895 RepID=UPI002B92460C|nr:EAL domain-containing protein [Thermomonas sp.]HOV96061.1 EAL domain-containing protein [Thermomonas sp.]
MNTTAGTGDDPAALRLALQQSRAALAAEHANYRALLDEVQRDKLLFKRVQELALIGGWQWNRASDALYLTSEAIHILGASTPPTTMHALLACLLPDDRRLLHNTLTRISEGTGFDLQLQGMQADGSVFWVSVIGEPDPQDPANDRFSGTLQDITERKHAEALLRHQAHTDALTGLLNRDAILDHIATQLHTGASAHLALLYIDLDRFKIVNDLLGHDAGDQLLVEAAQRIRDAVGNEGQIARFGGDEFLVATSTLHDAEHPERLARIIQSAFLVPFRLGKDDFSVTTSIGISRGSLEGNTPKQLIQNADVAMYESKRRRRNGFHTFSPALAKRQQERLQTETRLRRAIDNNEFHLVYQPQVDLRSGRIFAAEALLRWHNPELGPMPPDRFIDLAESTGEIVRIGRWVLQEACHQMRRWKEQDLPIERVSVNVSYRQFVGENLTGSVQQMLHEADLPGHALELELTERVLVEDVADTSVVFDELCKLGVRLSIDDFGEGYSALNYLRRLPIHALKLSHGFLQGIPGNKSDEAICQTVVGIARSLGLGMIAEGIETEAQRDHLLRLGVTIGQGFLFAPGLLPGELGKRLAAQRS